MIHPPQLKDKRLIQYDFPFALGVVFSNLTNFTSQIFRQNSKVTKINTIFINSMHRA